MESDACMMELRFAVCNMDLPLVVVVVGTGDKWKRSEVRVHDEYIEKFSTKQNLYSIFNGASRFYSSVY